MGLPLPVPGLVVDSLNHFQRAPIQYTPHAMLGFIIMHKISQWDKHGDLSVQEVLRYFTVTKFSSGDARYILAKKKLTDIIFVSPNKSKFEKSPAHEFSGLICYPVSALTCIEINTKGKVFPFCL